jgi:ADP-heptose:LPS heptosyltransferase
MTMETSRGSPCGPVFSIDVSASVPLAETAALVARADLCIGVDTGLVHLAASLGVPVAVLFGPTDPAVWAPQNSGVRVVRAPLGDWQNLEISAVWPAVETLCEG